MNTERFLHPFSPQGRYPIGGGNEGQSAPRKLEGGSNELYTREFKLPSEVEASLSKNQRKILLSLVRAARRFGQLYTEYDDKSDPRLPFYPLGVKKERILDAAKSNPEIISPYTIVSRSENGVLVATPMHKFYQDKLKTLGILDLLKRAADAAGRGKDKDIKLQRYLKAKAKAFENGDYEGAERIWLEREDEPIIDIAIGFYDTYSDRFLGIKYSAEAWVGVLDRQLTSDTQWFSDSFLKWWQQTTRRSAPRAKMRIEHTRIQSGQAARYEWSGNSLPCQSGWRAAMGSKFTIFKPVFVDKFLHQKLPNLRDLIDTRKILGITDSFVKLATLRTHIAHEIGHSLVPSENIQQRLQKHAAWLKELYCDLLALTGYRRVKGLNLRESEIALAMLLSEGYLEYQNQRKRPEYHKKSTILLNYLLEEGSIRVEEGHFTWEDTEAVFKGIASLLKEVQKMLEEGKFSDVQQLHDKYFDPTIYRHFLMK